MAAGLDMDHSQSIRVNMYIRGNKWEDPEPIEMTMVLSKSIGALKHKVEDIVDISADKQLWFIDGDLLEDTKMLDNYNVKDGTEINIFRDVSVDGSTIRADKTDDEMTHPYEAENLSNVWQCSECTSVNSLLLEICDKCGHERTDDEDPNWSDEDHYSSADDLFDKIESENLTSLVTPPSINVINPTSHIEHPHTNLEEPTQDKDNTKQMVGGRKDGYETLINLDNEPIAFASTSITCPICREDFPPYHGIALHNCLHEFCGNCLVGTIVHSETVEIRCPFVCDDYKCEMLLQDREIRALLTIEKYRQHEKKGLSSAQGDIPNSFQCQTVNCDNWCVADPDAKTFFCEVCKCFNCLKCKAIHEGEDCEQYKRREEVNDTEGLLTAAEIEKMLKFGNAMRCPDCLTLITKDGGCDAIRCRVCKLQLCWATKGPRWGPNGVGDLSGGCRCMDPDVCSPDCGGCNIPHDEDVLDHRYRMYID